MRWDSCSTSWRARDVRTLSRICKARAGRSAAVSRLLASVLVDPNCQLVCCSLGSIMSSAGVSPHRRQPTHVQFSEHPILAPAIEAASTGACPLFVAFPGANAADISVVARTLPAGTQVATASQIASASVPKQSHSPPRYTLLMIDATWQFAKEMFAVASPHLLPPHGPGVQVQLPPHMTPGVAIATQPCGPGEQASNGREEHEQNCAAVCSDTAAGAELAHGMDAPLLLRTEPLVRRHLLFPDNDLIHHGGMHRGCAIYLSAHLTAGPPQFRPVSAALVRQPCGGWDTQT